MSVPIMGAETAFVKPSPLVRPPARFAEPLLPRDTIDGRAGESPCTLLVPLTYVVVLTECEIHDIMTIRGNSDNARAQSLREGNAYCRISETGYLEIKTEYLALP